jgi:hypothetical protein
MRVQRQLSLILENRPGVLAAVCADLADRRINLEAIYVENLVDHSIVRMVVSRPDEAVHLLGEAGVLVFENEIIAVSLQNRPGMLAKVAERLGAAKVNIDYLYASIAPAGRTTAVYLRVSDMRKAQKALARLR